MQVDLDQHIPAELYYAVAELLAWLDRLKTSINQSNDKFYLLLPVFLEEKVKTRYLYPAN